MTGFVLVHGAFRGPWSWDRVAERLRTLGHTVTVPHLGGGAVRADHNVSTYAADVVAAMDGLDQLVLVAHSFGGFPAAVAADAEAPRISRLVWLDAALPVDGESNVDAPASREAWTRAAGGDGWSIAPVPVERLAIVDDADREWVRSRLARMPLAAFVQRVRLTGAIDAIPRRDFVLATGWAGNPYVAQAERLRDEGMWTVTTVDAGHELPVERPDWVVDLLTAGGFPAR